MNGFVHGVRVIEIGSTGAALLQPDYMPPRILSPSIGLTEVDWIYRILLVASNGVEIVKRPGGDGVAFDLDAAHELTLPPQSDDAIGQVFVCPLRAIDVIGNITDFAHSVCIMGSGTLPIPENVAGALDFSDPDNSAFIR